MDRPARLLRAMIGFGEDLFSRRSVAFTPLERASHAKKPLPSLPPPRVRDTPSAPASFLVAPAAVPAGAAAATAAPASSQTPASSPPVLAAPSSPAPPTEPPSHSPTSASPRSSPSSSLVGLPSSAPLSVSTSSSSTSASPSPSGSRCVLPSSPSLAHHSNRNPAPLGCLPPYPPSSALLLPPRLLLLLLLLLQVEDRCSPIRAVQQGPRVMPAPTPTTRSGVCPFQSSLFRPCRRRPRQRLSHRRPRTL